MLDERQAFGLGRHIVVEPVIQTFVIGALELGRDSCLNTYPVDELAVCMGDPDAVSDSERGLRSLFSGQQTAEAAQQGIRLSRGGPYGLAALCP